MYQFFNNVFERSKKTSDRALNSLRSIERNRSNRKRFVSFIFFIDSSKTRAIKLSINTCYVLSVFVGLVFVWSVASVFILTSLSKERFDLTQKLIVASNAIFEYETRYEGVFEAAYSNDNAEKDKNTEQSAAAIDKDKNKEVVSAANSEPKKIVPVKVVQTEPEQPKPVDVSQASPEQNEVVDTKTPIGSKIADEVVSSDLLVVESPQVESVPGYVKVEVNVRKNSDVGRAEGNIWALLKITRADGSSFYLGSPSNIGITPDGHVKAPAAGKSFSIRRFKTERFSIPVPAEVGKAGDKLTEIKVGLMGRDKKIKSVGRNLDINVQTKFVAKESNAQKPAIAKTPSDPAAVIENKNVEVEQPTKLTQPGQTTTAQPAQANQVTQPKQGVTQPVKEPQGSKGGAQESLQAKPSQNPVKPDLEKTDLVKPEAPSQSPQEGQNTQKAG